MSSVLGYGMSSAGTEDDFSDYQDETGPILRRTSILLALVLFTKAKCNEMHRVDKSSRFIQPLLVIDRISHFISENKFSLLLP